MCTATRSIYVKLDITGKNWKQVDSCMYLQYVTKKTLLIRVEGNGKLLTLEIGIIKTAAGGRAVTVTVLYGILLVAFSYNVEKIISMTEVVKTHVCTCIVMRSCTYKPTCTLLLAY
jgi:hypothetical protein